ncbi:MAG: methyltransferase [Planctomycetota bacterium]
MAHNNGHNELPPQARLMQFIVGRWISKPIYVAAELGIADLLANGPRSIADLAQASQSHAPSLYRMMRALASVGIFSEIEDKRFELTPMAECLKTGALRSIALLFHSDWSDKAWGCFLDSVKTGETAFEKAHGMPVSDWLEENPQAAAIFNEANAIKAAASHSAITEAYDFSGINTITDVGGGLGVLMAEILAATPHMEGTVADTPSVVRQARKLLRDRGLGHRCQAEECDFFKSISPGSDAYLLSNILHDWPDEQCHKILTNCRRAMRTDSKLLVMEMIVPTGNEPSVSKLLDLEMLVTTGGRERTESEFRELFGSSDFELARIIPTKEDVCIIEGIKRDQ